MHEPEGINSRGQGTKRCDRPCQAGMGHQASCAPPDLSLGSYNLKPERRQSCLVKDIQAPLMSACPLAWVVWVGVDTLVGTHRLAANTGWRILVRVCYVRWDDSLLKCPGMPTTSCHLGKFPPHKTLNIKRLCFPDGSAEPKPRPSIK